MTTTTKAFLLAVLFLIMATLAGAQTVPTYVMPAGQYNCQTTFRIPTSFYQFSCNISFLEQGGPGTGEMIGTNVLYFNPVGFGINAGSPPQYLSRKSKVLQDVAPTATAPGQATWEWQVQTLDGIYHVGVLTMTWDNKSCGRGGCRVTIEQCETTVDSSTVAILDELENNPFREPVTVAEFRWPTWLRWLLGASEPVEIYL